MDENNLFDLSDIEKIQEEIECDLQKIEPINIESPLEQKNVIDTTFEAASQEFSPKYQFLNMDEEWKNLLEEADPLHGTALTPDDSQLTGGFYRETIKNTTLQGQGFGSWFKKAVAIFLACTLGMGSLGFGIGAGMEALVRRNSTESTDIMNTQSDITLTSVAYTFENITEDPSTGTLADIVEALKPSVVGITSRIVQGPFEGEERQGSGLIFAENDNKIFIVTNHYVVQGGGNSFDISIAGSETIIGRPAGSDSAAHLAVLSVEKSQLVEAGIDTIVIATFGDSDQMRVGDTVLAIGNAMGYGNAVTRGVISASEQSVLLPVGHTLSLLQTDAAINYGNSGGPLINTRGEVIGINFDQASLLLFGRASIEGMGFSISSNIVAPILDDLVNGRRPALGIMGATITEQTAVNLGIAPLGVYVSTVIPGRAAYRAGMLESDVITGFNGLQVFNWDHLVQAIRTVRIGETVEVRVLRNGTEAITLYVELDVLVVESF